MKFTREDGTGLGSAPKLRTLEEKKHGSSSPTLRELEFLKEGLNALKSSEGQNEDQNKSESALSKLRHREHNPARQNFQKPKKRKEAGRSAKRAADDS